MLTKLSISNFALIDKLEVSFSNGMTSITGETGAGKSIILGALLLVVVMFRPTGLVGLLVSERERIGSFRRRGGKRRDRKQE